MEGLPRNDQQSQLYHQRMQKLQKEQQQQLCQLQIQQNMHGYSIPMHNNAIYSQQPVSNSRYSGDNGVNTSNCKIFLRLCPNVDMDKISDYWKATGVNIIKIEKVSHNSARFNSFKLSVHSNDYFKIINDPSWSLCGAKCRPWSEKGNNNYNNDFNNYMSSDNRVNSANNDRWDGISFNRNSFNNGR